MSTYFSHCCNSSSFMYMICVLIFHYCNSQFVLVYHMSTYFSLLLFKVRSCISYVYLFLTVVIQIWFVYIICLLISQCCNSKFVIVNHMSTYFSLLLFKFRSCISYVYLFPTVVIQSSFLYIICLLISHCCYSKFVLVYHMSTYFSLL